MARAGVPVFTASFGATDSTAAGSVEDLLRLADAALLDAKAQGRDRVVVAERGLLAEGIRPQKRG